MHQQHELVRHNPYKVAPSAGRRNNPRIAQAWEHLQKDAPKLYQSIREQEAYFEAQQPHIDAILDDANLMAELEGLVHMVKQRQYVSEYALLGIEPGSSKRDIKNAYRRQARKLHPDKGGDEAAMKTLNAAYKRLLAATKA